jgi:hypothetical protein
LQGGKRVRPMLVYASGELLGQTNAAALDAAAAAVECIHAYSLIHDDLPAMDNDDLRRGKPTVHKAFDEATAILAGDALQALAFELLSRHQNGLSAERQLRMVQELGRDRKQHWISSAKAKPSIAPPWKACTATRPGHSSVQPYVWVRCVPTTWKKRT